MSELRVWMAWPQTRAPEKNKATENTLEIVWGDLFVKGQVWKVSREEKARVFCEGARASWPGVVIALKTHAHS